MKSVKFFFIFLTILSSILATAFSKDVKIAFFSTSLGYRGTEIALYDYAHFNEKILGNVSYIFNCKNNHPVVDKFVNRFNDRCYFGLSFDELDEIILKEKIDIVYSIKYGSNDGVLFKNAKNVVHAVFDSTSPHGDVYAAISDWLNENQKQNNPVVPHMIHLDNTTESLREELHIPKNAIVFGRHGGDSTFNLEFVKKAIIKTLLNRRNNDIWFVFLNTPSFYKHKRIIYLPPSADLKYKTKFINTCDAMIHARNDGETFGLACGEFSIKNKPVITCKIGEQAHISILGDKGIYYDYLDEKSLIKIFESFHSFQKGNNYDMYSEKYGPEAVMRTFEEVFIKPFFP